MEGSEQGDGMMDPSFHRVPLCVALGEGKKGSNGKAGAPVRRLLQKPPQENDDGLDQGAQQMVRMAGYGVCFEGRPHRIC